MVAVGLIAGLVVAVAACGGDDDTSDETSNESEVSNESSAGADADAFPVTIEHKYGTTEIAEPPERVVTVGLTDQDAVLALGVVPVGTTEWYGEHPSAIWPWAQDELEALDAEAAPEVVGD
jgi:iron-siderophore transport system substrate-binding protein